MSLPTPSLAVEAAAAGSYPYLRFNQRERKLLESVKVYVDASVGTLPPGSVALADLSSGIAPSHVIKFAGNVTSLGGAASEAFTITGLATTDIVLLTVKDNGPSNVTILEHSLATNQLTIVFSANPGAGAIVSYVVHRAAV